MQKLLLINSSLNTSSTGRITEEIGLAAQNAGYEVYAAYGRNEWKSSLKTIKIGSKLDLAIHLLQTRLFDNHGYSSYFATQKFIRTIDHLNPDIVHIHNLHGYYLHVGLLFSYLAQKNIPVVWTFHDCWPITGHCSYFDSVNCTKWQTVCTKCPNQRKYPESLFFDFSTRNFLKKKYCFHQPKNITVVTPSGWLANIVSNSHLQNYLVKVINNGIDLQTFKIYNERKTAEKYNLQNFKIMLGVASVWDKRKGLSDFVKLSSLISDDCRIVLIGLTKKQTQGLPPNIIPISRTENTQELAHFYSLANVFVNPTYVDNFPTTNLEALACGTPVVTYNTGGSPEAIDVETGFVVDKGDLVGLHNAIMRVLETEKSTFQLKCRLRAEKYYGKNDRYNEYIRLYEKIIIQ